MKESKQEFEDAYIERSRINREFYDRCFITVSCDCGEDMCIGWATQRKEVEQ